MTTRSTAPADGRTVRAARTRDAVVEAMLSLIDEGGLRPTARDVSERAGVSLRSVFQHFQDLEALFAAAADRQVARLSALAVRIAPDLPFAERLACFVEARARLFEAVTPVRRASLLQEPFSREIAGRLRWSRETNRAEAERLFAPELSALGPEESATVSAALHAATEWYTWETLRVHDGLSENDARKVMTYTISALLSPLPPLRERGRGVR